jgi:hypothetical protein
VEARDPVGHSSRREAELQRRDFMAESTFHAGGTPQKRDVAKFGGPLYPARVLAAREHERLAKRIDELAGRLVRNRHANFEPIFLGRASGKP